MPLARILRRRSSVLPAARARATASDVVAALNAEGYWPAHLGYNSHPYTRDGSTTVTRGNFCQTQVGDETDTSPFTDDTLIGISTAAVRAQHGDAHPRAAGQPLMRVDVARQILAFCACRIAH